jgi:hypothetical protein
MPKYPAHIQAQVDAAERMGHKLVSLGCALFRCTLCNVKRFLDEEAAALTRDKCKPIKEEK